MALKIYEEWLALYEEKVAVSIGKNQVGSVDTNDTDTIRKIQILTADTPGKEDLVKVFNTMNIGDNTKKFIFDILQAGDWNKAYNFILNERIDITSILGKKFNAISLTTEKLGLSSSDAHELFGYANRSQPVTGSHELWFILLLDKAKSANRGDVDINGKILEVKGKGARMYGQSGYSDAKTMGLHQKNTIIKLSKYFGLNSYNVLDGNGLEWSVTKKEGRLLEANLKSIAKAKGGFTENDQLIISNHIIEAYKNYFVRLDVKKYGSILKDSIGTDGTLELASFHKELLKMSFDYYQEEEQFDYFTMCNKDTGNVIVIQPSNFANLVDTNQVLYDPPSWGSLAGVQGGNYAIAIDKIS